jgi:hypothetical protein
MPALMPAGALVGPDAAVPEMIGALPELIVAELMIEIEFPVPAKPDH